MEWWELYHNAEKTYFSMESFPRNILTTSSQETEEARMKESNAEETRDEVQTPQELDPLAGSPHRQKVLRAVLLQRWTAIGGILSLGVLYVFISPRLTFAFFPRWLPLVLEVILVLPFVKADELAALETFW